MKHVILVLLCLLFQVVPTVAQQTNFSEKNTFIVNDYDAQGFIIKAKVITFSLSDKPIKNSLLFWAVSTSNRNANIAIYERDEFALGNFKPTRVREVKSTRGNLLKRHYRRTNQNKTLIRKLNRKDKYYFLPFVEDTSQIFGGIQVQHPIDHTRYFPMRRYVTGVSYDKGNDFQYFFNTNIPNDSLVNCITEIKNSVSNFPRLNTIFLDLNVTEVQATFLSQEHQDRFLPTIQAQFPNTIVIPIIDTSAQLTGLLTNENIGRRTPYDGVVELSFRGVPKF